MTRSEFIIEASQWIFIFTGIVLIFAPLIVLLILYIKKQRNFLTNQINENKIINLELSETEKELITKYRKLSDKQKEIVIGRIEEMTKEDKIIY